MLSLTVAFLFCIHCHCAPKRTWNTVHPFWSHCMLSLYGKDPTEHSSKYLFFRFTDEKRKSYEFEITRRWVNHESWQNFHFCVKWPFKCISMSLNSKPQSYSLIVCELLMSRVFRWRTVRLSPAWIFLCMQSTAIFKTSLFCQFYTLPQQMRAFLLNELIKYLLYELQTRASLSSINMHCFL